MNYKNRMIEKLLLTRVFITAITVVKDGTDREAMASMQEGTGVFTKLCPKLAWLPFTKL
jgi:hypothetical protein